MNNTAKAIEHPESPWSFTFADRLGKALHVSGVSTQEMADALGVTRTTITNYTSGRTKPSKLQIKEWAFKTGAPIEWLINGIDPTENPHQTPGGGKNSEPPAYGVLGRRFAEIIPFPTRHAS